MENLINDLNAFLSDLNVFYQKLQNYHWNVEGNNFFLMHGKLEEYYEEIHKEIDEIAELILAIGGQPFGTLKTYLINAKIEEATDQKIKGSSVFEGLSKDYFCLLQDAKKIKKKADSLEEYQIASVMDDLIKKYSKNIWMLKQSMK